MNALALLAIVIGWFAIGGVVHHIGAMPSKQVLLAVAIGALLPFVPELVALVPSLPKVVANAITAIALAVAYKLVPKDGAK